MLIIVSWIKACIVHFRAVLFGIKLIRIKYKGIPNKRVPLINQRVVLAFNLLTQNEMMIIIVFCECFKDNTEILGHMDYVYYYFAKYYCLWKIITKDFIHCFILNKVFLWSSSEPSIYHRHVGISGLYHDICFPVAWIIKT